MLNIASKLKTTNMATMRILFRKICSCCWRLISISFSCSPQIMFHSPAIILRSSLPPSLLLIYLFCPWNMTFKGDFILTISHLTFLCHPPDLSFLLQNSLLLRMAPFKDPHFFIQSPHFCLHTFYLLFLSWRWIQYLSRNIRKLLPYCMVSNATELYFCGERQKKLKYRNRYLAELLVVYRAVHSCYAE
jgi:hypothetical protein